MSVEGTELAPPLACLPALHSLWLLVVGIGGKRLTFIWGTDHQGFVHAPMNIWTTQNGLRVFYWVWCGGRHRGGRETWEDEDDSDAVHDVRFPNCKRKREYIGYFQN